MDKTIFESKYRSVFINEDQHHLGRTVIVLKSECENLSNMKTYEREELQYVIKKVETILKKAFGPTMFNRTCLMNNAYKSPNSKPHIHRHCKPRYEKPVLFAGMEFVDEDFAHHYDHKKKLFVDEGVLGEILAKIKEFI